MTAALAPIEPSDDAPPDAVAATALEEAQFLCRQLWDALESPDLAERDLASFEQRLAGFVDALISRGPRTLEWLAKILPAAATAADACGIATVLLASRDPRAAQVVLAALEAADEPLLQGLHMALRRGPVDLVQEQLRSWFASGSARQAAAAAEALLFHRKLEANSPRLAQLLSDIDPQVRRAAWRATALAS